jgi:hypothetical protein
VIAAMSIEPRFLPAGPSVLSAWRAESAAGAFGQSK